MERGTMNKKSRPKKKIYRHLRKKNKIEREEIEEREKRGKREKG